MIFHMFGFQKPDVPQVDAAEVIEAIQKKKTFVLLDVRTPEEYLRGHIEESINIPVGEISQRVEEELPDKNKVIYVYCLSGSRSASAVLQMQKMGYENMYSMTSGLLAWRSKGYPMTLPEST